MRLATLVAIVLRCSDDGAGYTLLPDEVGVDVLTDMHRAMVGTVMLEHEFIAAAHDHAIEVARASEAPPPSVASSSVAASRTTSDGDDSDVSGDAREGGHSDAAGRDDRARSGTGPVRRMGKGRLLAALAGLAPELRQRRAWHERELLRALLGGPALVASDFLASSTSSVEHFLSHFGGVHVAAAVGAGGAAGAGSGDAGAGVGAVDVVQPRSSVAGRSDSSDGDAASKRARRKTRLRQSSQVDASAFFAQLASTARACANVTAMATVFRGDVLLTAREHPVPFPCPRVVLPASMLRSLAAGGDGSLRPSVSATCVKCLHAFAPTVCVSVYHRWACVTRRRQRSRAPSLRT